MIPTSLRFTGTVYVEVVHKRLAYLSQTIDHSTYTSRIDPPAAGSHLLGAEVNAMYVSIQRRTVEENMKCC